MSDGARVGAAQSRISSATAHRALAIVIALGAGTFSPVNVGAQAGTSSSSVNVSKKCSDAQSGTSSTSADCPTTAVNAGEGSAFSASDNAHRAAIAAADLVTGPDKKNGNVTASSTQFSQLLILGTPEPGSELVFDFRTHRTGGVENGNSKDDTDEASWELALFGDGGVSASVTKTFFSSSATPSTIVFDNAIKASHGFDLTVPLTTTGLFDYSFDVSAEAVITKGEPEGTELAAAIEARLRHIELVDANGNVIAQAHFDRTTGFATIDVTPEPASRLLVTSGLTVLAVVGRFARRRIA